MNSDLIQIIIFAMIAAFVAFRLIATFGRHPGDERPSSHDGLDQSGIKPPLRPADLGDGGETSGSASAYLHVSAPVQKTLTDIGRIDRHFDAIVFLDGARQAYEMILEAFWKADEEAFKPFVDEDILANFQAAIKAREDAGHLVSNRLVSLNKANIVNAELLGNNAQITVAFDADIIAAVHDQDGHLIEGSMSDTHQVKDSWTFARDLSSRDPNWTLIETASAE